jgi:biopolymer transport protein ExbB/TolQ
MVASLFGIVAGIGSSFYALETNESAGFGAVGSGVQFALISNVAFLSV